MAFIKNCVASSSLFLHSFLSLLSTILSYRSLPPSSFSTDI